MTKPLFVKQVNPAAFTLPNSPSFPTITASEITANGLGVCLYPNGLISSDAKFTIKYTATGTNDINGINGSVDNFILKNY